MVNLIERNTTSVKCILHRIKYMYIDFLLNFVKKNCKLKQESSFNTLHSLRLLFKSCTSYPSSSISLFYKTLSVRTPIEKLPVCNCTLIFYKFINTHDKPLLFFKFKIELNEATELKDMDALKSALQLTKTKNVENRLTEEVVRAKAMLDRLRNIAKLMHAVLGLDQKTIAEIRGIKHTIYYIVIFEAQSAAECS